LEATREVNRLVEESGGLPARREEGVGAQLQLVASEERRKETGASGIVSEQVSGVGSQICAALEYSCEPLSADRRVIPK
jgi:hypothetical protein